MARFVQVARDCQGTYGPLNIQLDRLNELLSVLGNNTLRERADILRHPEPLNAVPIAIRRGAGPSTRRAALRQLSLINDAGLKIVVKTWLDILNANKDLRVHALADVVDLLLHRKQLDEVIRSGPNNPQGRAAPRPRP